MTVRPVSVLLADPEPERRARIRACLDQLGEGPAVIFHGLCLLLDEDLGLEGRPMRGCERRLAGLLDDRRPLGRAPAQCFVPAVGTQGKRVGVVGEALKKALGVMPEAFDCGVRQGAVRLSVSMASRSHCRSAVPVARATYSMPSRNRSPASSARTGSSSR